MEEHVKGFNARENINHGCCKRVWPREGPGLVCKWGEHESRERLNLFRKNGAYECINAREREREWVCKNNHYGSPLSRPAIRAAVPPSGNRGWEGADGQSSTKFS